MKKMIIGTGIISIVLWASCAALAADKVVVIPLNSKASVSFETVSHQYSIPGTSFQPLRQYGQTEANGYEVIHQKPGPFFNSPGLIRIPHGVAHNKDAGKMSFSAPVHLPQGAVIGHLGVAVCSGNDTLTDHDIDLQLVKTDMTSGTGTQYLIRSYNITSTNCGTSQGSSGLLLIETVDNSKYTYEFRLTGIEGGTCSGFTMSCDERRTRIQFAHISYATSEVVQP